jgi:energy-coupling factor transport system permease protein
MIKDITIGQYFPGNSLLHQADARTKIILTFIFTITVLLISSYTAFFIFAAFTLLAIRFSQIPIRYTLKGLKPIMYIIIFSAVINIFTTEGTVLFEYGFIKFTYEGIDTSAKIALRLSLLIISTSVLTLTTTPISLTDGLEKLLNPLKRLHVPVHEFAMMMTIALRFIPTLMEETDKIIKAQTSRGADFDSGNLIQRAKSFIPVLIPLFISAFRRADELALAMEARCYRGGKGRTRMKQLKLTGVDLKLLSIVMLFEILLLYIQYIKKPV